ncbi:hypothetical protein ACFLXA_00135 [Chloroflexota bacterium]
MAQQAPSADRKAYLRKRMKEEHGWTDEELDSLSLKQWRRLDLQPGFRDYWLIAEVVQAKHCGLDPKPGDKFVFASACILLPEESTFPAMCLWAMSRVFPFTNMVMDRIIEGLDPNDIWFDHVKCTDTGVGCGGLGEVLFRIHCEKVPKEKQRRF